MKEGARKIAINHFFKLHGKSINRCHEPQEKCDQQAIRAHSIPSSTIITRLASDGHVVMPQMKLKVPPPAEIEFKRVGNNNATTFTGLCSKHDNLIFRPIDVALPDFSNKEHLFLLAYRAVLREYHVVLENAVRFQASYQKQIDLGMSQEHVPCDYGTFVTHYLCNAFECYEYKRHYDRAYLKGDWNALKHYVIAFRNQKPTIAVSSMFSLDDVDAPETPRVTLSVFPANSDVVVVFSTIPTDAPFVEAYLNRILTSDSFFQKYLLSKLVLQSCDNFVIAPMHYDAMPQDAKDAICHYYVDTIINTYIPLFG